MHHALVHEGRVTIEKDYQDRWFFKRPDGRAVPACGYRAEDMTDDDNGTAEEYFHARASAEVNRSAETSLVREPSAESWMVRERSAEGYAANRPSAEEAVPFQPSAEGFVALRPSAEGYAPSSFVCAVCSPRHDRHPDGRLARDHRRLGAGGWNAPL